MIAKRSKGMGGRMSEAELLQLIGRSIREADPVPPTATRAAEESFAWRLDGADIALLVGGSERSLEPELAMVRAADDDRFEWESPRIRVEGDWQPDGSLVGSVRPFPDSASVGLETDAGLASIDVTPGGRFVIRAERRSVVRIVVSHGDGVTSTEWFVVDP